MVCIIGEIKGVKYYKEYKDIDALIWNVRDGDFYSEDEKRCIL